MERSGRQFSSTRWRNTWTLAFFLSATFVAVVYSAYFEFSWISVFFIGFSVLSFLAFIESASDYIHLDENEIRFRRLFRKTSVNKRAIERVKWEKGSGVSLRLISGEWVKIPNMGHNSQGLANSLRSWIAND